VFLSERDEARWLDAAEVRIVPADQRFDADQGAVAQLDHWLIEHVQPLLPERARKSPHQLFVGPGRHR